MGQEQIHFNLNLKNLTESASSSSVNRAQAILCLILEAYYSSHGAPKVRDYKDLLHQVAQLLWENQNDVRPIHILYSYFISVGSEHMDRALQDLGHYLVKNYAISSEDVEEMLNMVVRRLTAIGRMRHIQRQHKSLEWR